MKRVAVGLVYLVGAISVGYLALYAYAVWRGNPFQPGDPIKIFRKDDAPSYSSCCHAGTRHFARARNPYALFQFDMPG